MSGHEHVMPSADGTTGREILTDYGRLIVSECDDGDIVPGCAHVTVDCKPAAIPAGQFPHLIAALYESAGKPAPVILDRPELPPDGWVMPGHNIGTVDFDGCRVVVRAYQDGWYLPPDRARELAAYLVAYADRADTEPDPAEVEAIVAKIGEEIGGAWVGRDLRIARAAARSALRSVREREATP